jgi:hypothetical protein
MIERMEREGVVTASENVAARSVGAADRGGQEFSPQRRGDADVPVVTVSL